MADAHDARFRHADRSAPEALKSSRMMMVRLSGNGEPFLVAGHLDAEVPGDGPGLVGPEPDDPAAGESDRGPRETGPPRRPFDAHLHGAIVIFSRRRISARAEAPSASSVTGRQTKDGATTRR